VKFANEVINCIPTNWLDNFLTGDERIIKTYPCEAKDVENLLRAIKQRVKDTVSKFHANSGGG